MSRRKKNLRAFMHNRESLPTVTDTWNAAWESAQGIYASTKHNEQQARIEELEVELAKLEKTIAVIKDITLDGELSWKEKHKWISKEVDDE